MQPQTSNYLLQWQVKYEVAPIFRGKYCEEKCEDVL